MAIVLGISAYYHDAAAALVVDGHVAAAIQQERLSRIKNDADFPLAAAEACLQVGGLQPSDLDAVVFYEQPFDKLERVLVSLLRGMPRTWRQFPRALGQQVGTKLWVLDRLAESFGLPRPKVLCFDHHRCHAASAAFVSPFPESAVLVVDGVGEHASTSIWDAHGSQLDLVTTLDFPHSLGLLYAGLTAYLGFAVNEGEYKVMGLAAFGTPRFRDEFARLIKLHPDGSYELCLDYFDHFTDAELGFGPGLERLLGPRRPPERAWDLKSPADQHYADIAATLQIVAEEALVGLARAARHRTQRANLCLAGGVALNAVANATIARASEFERVFVTPAAGDAGGALGAAILGALSLGDPRPGSLQTAALGQPLDGARAYALATELGLRPRRVDDPRLVAAELVAANKLVGFVQGRFEWGPRALGQRSLLANPRDAATRDRLNQIIKRRELFRPFAPAVLAEHTASFFEATPNDMTPWMTTVAPVRPEARESLAAVTHVDGSARLQTISAAQAPAMHGVVSHLERQGLAPVVLNTSLNGAGEPMVASAEDALAFWLRHPIDAMILDDLVLERRP